MLEWYGLTFAMAAVLLIDADAVGPGEEVDWPDDHPPELLRGAARHYLHHGQAPIATAR